MAMAMNIKNPEAHELAQKVAELTGETLTEAVTTALRERLDRLLPEQRRSGDERERRLAAMKALIAKTAPIMRQGPSSAEMDDLLYDEDGLPK